MMLGNASLKEGFVLPCHSPHLDVRDSFFFLGVCTRSALAGEMRDILSRWQMQRLALFVRVTVTSGVAAQQTDLSVNF